MTKKSLLFLTVLISLFFFVLVSSGSGDETRKYIQNLTSLTKLPGLALSTPYLEKRILYYGDDSNKLYVGMKNKSQMDFVYAK